MIKDNYKYFNRLHILIDSMIIVITFIVAWWLKFQSGLFMIEGHALSMQRYFSVLFIIVPLYIVLYSIQGLYTSRHVRSKRYETYSILKANIFGMLIFIAILYVVKQPHFSRTVVFMFFWLNIIIDVFFRILIKKGLVYIRKKGFNIKRIVLVGYSRAAEGYIDRIVQNPQWGYEIIGIVDDNMSLTSEYKGVKIIGKINHLSQIIEDDNIEEIAITLALQEYSKFEEIVALCEKSGVHTQFVPDYNRVIPTQSYTEDVQGLPVINIRYIPLTNSINQVLKRVVDVFGSGIALILLAPLMLAIALIIKLTSKGPVIFKQERIGLHNKKFTMFKFRTMKVQDAASECSKWTKKGDPRVTGIGKILRCTSLDELPQLINIFMGNMSLVGPRPERPFFVNKFKEEIPRYMIKHQVRPGLTGWAQINGYRGDTSIDKRIEYDLYYIENWTMGFDFRIMFLTIFKGFINRNAY